MPQLISISKCKLFLVPKCKFNLVPKCKLNILFLSVNVTVCLYAPTPKWTAKFEGETKENDEGSDEEMNMTEERGRR